MVRCLRSGAAVLAAALLLAGCGPPVGVSRVSPRTVSRELTANALNSDQPSAATRNVLHRWNLAAVYRRDPPTALRRLHELAIEHRERGSLLFALAELSFNHAEVTGRREYYLEAAVCAWAFLFPGADEAPPDPIDPRLRTAADIYNRALTRAFASADGAEVLLQPGLYPLPFGQQLAIHMAPDALRWDDRDLVELVPAAELRVRGLQARHRRAGIGAPLAARAVAAEPPPGAIDYLGPNARTAVTALLRLGEARQQLAAPIMHGTLEVFTGSEQRTVDIDGRAVRLEIEPTAALAWTLSQSPKWRWERRGFFFGDLLREEIPSNLTFAQPYQRGRIPVVFVHGTASSAGRWADMLNDLSNDPGVRDRYQFWFFHYASGSPIPYSAMVLRDALSEALRQVDPDGSDAALREMVVVGHSQGGLLVKLTAVDTGTRLWDAVSQVPLDQIEVRPDTRDLLERALIVQPLPFVRSVIFVATPHRGSPLANRSLAGLVARFVTLPADVLGATADLMDGNGDALTLDPRGPRFGSIYGMQTNSPLLLALAATPVAPGISAHSIIPVRGAAAGPDATDGVVTFASARHDGVESELIIPFAGHSVQGHPLAIEEVRRILLAHAQAVCARDGVACGRRGPLSAADAAPAAE
ncbi:MAG: hypothetical protein SF182_09415 [Deltaproteobacteria bacterium]|nr:hypothetical protein [Deltaproteobacteria bacterium]